MKIIEIEPLYNGAHRNQETSETITIPRGWAVIPEDMVCENFPFGEVEAAEVDGVMTVIKWTPGEMPEPDPVPEGATWDEMAAAIAEGVNEV